MLGRGMGSGAGWSVRAQLVAIVAVVGVLLAGAGAWLAAFRMNEAAEQAQADAEFQAGRGAAAVADAITQGKAVVAGLAGGFPVPKLLADSSQCQLAFSELACSRPAISISCCLTARCRVRP
jgi:hypothetical protein